MSAGKTLLGAGDGLLDRILCVAGAILFSQLPEFIQQYLQRLGGHLDEARRALEQFRATAAHSRLTLDRFITQTAANADPAVARLARVMTDAVVRVDDLAAAQAAITQAPLWSRPFVFLRHLDPRIAGATWDIFKPAVPTTLEGLVYALAGMLVLLGVYHLGLKPALARLFRRRGKAAPAAA
jgi:hypothetical protein